MRCKRNCTGISTKQGGIELPYVGLIWEWIGGSAIISDELMVALLREYLTYEEEEEEEEEEGRGFREDESGILIES